VPATLAATVSESTTPAPPVSSTPAPLIEVEGESFPGRSEGFELVGRADLGGRGWNAGLALAGSCAYIGNRRLPSIAIVDISDPAAPRPAGELPLSPGSQPIELRGVPDLNLLIVLNWSSGLSILTFDVSDCQQPRALASLGLGATPHEFYLWRDPANQARLLMFIAMWNYLQPDLRVVDLSDPAAPVQVGEWNSNVAGAPGTLHSLSVSRDGRLAYLALWGGGFLLADSSDFAAGMPEPELRLVRDVAGAFVALPGLNTHSAVPLADPRYVLLTQEIYYCPFAGVLVADTLEPARPAVAGHFSVPENDPACSTLPRPDAVFTSHNPLIVGDLAFVTWYGGGLQVLDLSDPADPRRVAVYVPSGEGGSLSSYPSAYPIQMWSYPILHHGLIYVADIQSGLHILRYTGHGAEAVRAVAHLEGNASPP